MKILRLTGAFCILAGLFLTANSIVAQQAAPEKERNASIWIAEIRGTINPASADFLQSAIRKAERDHAEALIVELDTPGGLVTSVRQMAQLVDEANLPVVVYVTPAGASATSAGALLTIASHVAAMAPGTNIGAAHPVGAQGKEIEGAMGEKVVQDIAAFARGLADLRGRNPELAEKIVKESTSLTASEALNKNIIDVIAENRSELLKKIDGRKVKLRGARSEVIRTEGVQVKTAEMSWGQELLHYLANPNIAAVLMTLGMLLIYVELSNPGITIAGVLGVICLLIAFIAFQTLPIRTGGLALVILGLILLAAEPFVPTTGALAAGGAIAFVLGLLWLIDPDESNLRVSMAVWLPAGLALGSGAVLVGVAAARIRKLSEETYARIGGSSLMGLSGYKGVVEAVSEEGKSGMVHIRGETWNFVSAVPLKVGDTVEVEKAEGMKLLVKKEI